MFIKDTLKPKFSIQSAIGGVGDDNGDIVHFDCQSGVAATLHMYGKVCVRDLDDDAELFSDKVKAPHRVFVHPLGAHVVVTTADGDLHYYATYDRRIRASCNLNQGSASKLASVFGTAKKERSAIGNAVLWDSIQRATPQNPCEVLSIVVGAAEGGVLYGVTVSMSPNSAKLHFRTLHAIPQMVVGSTPITSVVCETLGGEVPLVMVASPVCVFRARGTERGQTASAIMEHVHAGDVSGDVEDVTGHHHHHTTANDSAGCGKLVVVKADTDVAAQSYGWLSAAGVLVHDVLPLPCSMTEIPPSLGSATGLDSQAQPQYLPVVRERGAQQQQQQLGSALPESPPLDFTLSAFHMFFLYSSRIVVLGHPAGVSWGLNPTLAAPTPAEVAERIVYDMQTSPLLGIVRDVHERRVFVYGASRVWQLRVQHECRGQMQRVFLPRAESALQSPAHRARYYRAAFRLSAAYANAALSDEILFGWAELYARQGLAAEAVGLLATLSSDVGSMYTMLAGSAVLHGAAGQFLEAKLRGVLLPASRRKTLPAAVLEQLWCVLPLCVSERLGGSGGDGADDNDDDEAFLEWLRSLVDLVVERAPSVLGNAPFVSAMVRLLREQGAPRAAQYFAEKGSGFAFVVSDCLRRHAFGEAVAVLRRHCCADAFVDLWYCSAARLVREAPEEFTDALLELMGAVRREVIDVERLLPAYLGSHGRGGARRQLARVLTQSMARHQCASEAAHDVYVALLVEAGDPAALRRFLRSPAHAEMYDPQRALRACLGSEAGRRATSSIVYLYQRLGLYEPALHCLLQADSGGEDEDEDDNVDERGREETEMAGGENAALLAKVRRCVALLREAQFRVSADELKKLWVTLVNAVVQRGSAAVTFRVVEWSAGVVQLGDVIGAVDDDTAIFQYKGVITHEITDKNNDIARSRERTEKAYDTLAHVKRELRGLRTQRGYITATQRCPLCGRRILLQHGAEPFLLYPNCQHAVHERCAIARWDTVGGVAALLADEGGRGGGGWGGGIKTTEELARADCAVCGEALILEIDVPLTNNDDPAWAL